jgi:hypothetical protein
MICSLLLNSLPSGHGDKSDVCRAQDDRISSEDDRASSSIEYLLDGSVNVVTAEEVVVRLLEIADMAFPVIGDDVD